MLATPRLRQKAAGLGAIFVALALLVVILFLFEQGVTMRGYVPPLDYVIAALIMVGTVLIPTVVLIFLLKYRLEIVGAMYANPKRWFGLFARRSPRIFAELFFQGIKAAIRPMVFAGLVILFMILGFWLVQSWNLSEVMVPETSETEAIGETEIQETTLQYSRETVLAVAASSAFAAYFSLRVLEWIYGVMVASFVRRRRLMRPVILKLLQRLGRIPGLRFLARVRRRVLFAISIAVLAGASIGYFFGSRALRFVSGIFAASPVIIFVFVGVASGIFIGAIFILAYHVASTGGTVSTD